MKRKRIIFPLIAVLWLVSFTLVSYLRYKNQNFPIHSFDIFKAGNIMTGIFAFLMMLFICLNLFNKSSYPLSGLIFLLAGAGAAAAALIISNTNIDKDIKIILSAFFLLMSGYELVILLVLSFTRSKKLHYISNALLTLFIAAVLFVINIAQIYFYKDDFTKYSEKGAKADAGVILGAAVWGGKRPSPVFRERINKGYEVYSSKFVNKLVLTGGGSGEISEAEVARTELMKFGVNENNLIVEKESNSTMEQLWFVRDSLYKKYNWKKIIIISDNFHLFRSSEICKFNDINVDCIATDTPLTTEGGLNYSIKESFAVLFFWIFGIG
ncbi:MAG TPA: YdcF family protein [Ignavibacteria bacterium]|nr:YdcF family protein [Ignavibacteria bacterium]